jgi:hypothetical protein
MRNKNIKADQGRTINMDSRFSGGMGKPNFVKEAKA